jgi:2,3-bisphosphoglycerate-dependent phosphoglycerate mutase
MPSEPPGRLIALRHGCSTWNAAGRFTGSADVDLSDEGRCEATEAGLVLRRAAIQPALVVSSSLRRARRSAEIVDEVCGWSARLVVTSDLDERDHGVLEGLTLSEAEAEFGAQAVRGWRRTGLGGPPSGESFGDVLARVRRAWEAVIEPVLEQGRTVAVVGHGTSLRCLLVASGAPTEIACEFEVPRARPARITRPEGRWQPLVPTR